MGKNSGLVYRNRIRELERQLEEKARLTAAQSLRISFLSRERHEKTLDLLRTRAELRDMRALNERLMKEATLRDRPAAPSPSHTPLTVTTRFYSEDGTRVTHSVESRYDV